MKIGRNYIIIERWRLCIGFGKPPAEQLALIDRSRRHEGV